MFICTYSSYTSPDADSSGGATFLDSGISAVIGKVQSVFISGELKVFRLYSVFYQLPKIYCMAGSNFEAIQKMLKLSMGQYLNRHNARSNKSVRVRVFVLIDQMWNDACVTLHNI